MRHMAYPEDSFRPRNRKSGEFIPIDEIPDPTTLEGYQKDETYLDEDEHDPVHPNQRPSPNIVAQSQFAQLENKDRVEERLEIPAAQPHDEIVAKYDRDAESEFLRKRDERIKYFPSKQETQGRRGKEPPGKHQKGGEAVRGPSEM